MPIDILELEEEEEGGAPVTSVVLTPLNLTSEPT